MSNLKIAGWAFIAFIALLIVAADPELLVIVGIGIVTEPLWIKLL